MCMYMHKNNHNDYIINNLTISVLDGTAISVFDGTMIPTGSVLAYCDQSTK